MPPRPLRHVGGPHTRGPRTPRHLQNPSPPDRRVRPRPPRFLSRHAVGADQSNIMLVGDVVGQDIRHAQTGLGHERVARQEFDVAIPMPRRAGLINERRFQRGQTHELCGDAIRHIGSDGKKVSGCAAEQGESGGGRMIGIVHRRNSSRTFEHKGGPELDREKLGVARHGSNCSHKACGRKCRLLALNGRVIPANEFLF
jgi:hypothetical protein